MPYADVIKLAFEVLVGRIGIICPVIADGPVIPSLDESEGSGMVPPCRSKKGTATMVLRRGMVSRAGPIRSETGCPCAQANGRGPGAVSRFEGYPG